MVRDGDTSGWGTGTHPLLDAVTTIETALDSATAALTVGTDPAWLPAGDQGLLLEGLARIEQRVAAMKLATLVAVDGPDGIASSTGARSAADWLAHRLHLSPRRTGGEARLGARVAPHRVLATAMLDGEASPDHARAVLDCLDAIPADLVEPDSLEAAESILVDLCRAHTPREITCLGRRILELLAPETAEQIEAERLARAEREALRRTRLNSKPIGEGLIRVTADIPALHASLLDTVLDTMANPRRPDGSIADDGRHLSPAQRRGRAFVQLIEKLDTRDLPRRHGTAATVTVLVDEATLRDDLDTAGIVTTSTGVDLTLGEARRLMCQARIWPAVMGGASVVLDAGTKRRLHEGAMREAMEVAHPVCQAVGCDVPAAWCDGHHKTPWSAGGHTTAEDGAIVCGHHHRRLHDAGYTHTWHPDGSVTFHRRT